MIEEPKSAVDLESLITQGGDKRIEILSELGTNKYFVNPADYQGLLNRGSCTCSALNEETEAILHEAMEREIHQLYRMIRIGLKKLLNFPGEDRFDVFLAPSGSDLTYYPILFSQLLHPDKEILSLVSCPEELGSGTIKAAKGQYFMSQNQFGESVQEEGQLFDSGIIETKSFPARAENGEINDHRTAISRYVKDIDDRAMIGYLVVGSKSGIENDIKVVTDTKKDILWVVDLCQFRNRKILINDLLDKGCAVMITGSKFYQSPPFCGALLVPKALSRKLESVKDIDFAPYQRLFSQNDIPPSLPQLRSRFQPFENRGLAMRWVCALHEMREFDRLPHEDTGGLIRDWFELCTSEINAKDNLELMPNQDQTNDSIISFRAKYDERYLTPEEMKELFKLVVTSRHQGFKKFARVFIGQPVIYGDKAFLRIALGSYNVRRLLKTGIDFHNDRHLIFLINKLVPDAVSSTH